MAKCYCCPRKCGVTRAANSGGCGENAPLPGVCRSPVAPVVARAALHHWEEPVISGKNGSGTVFFSGCNLHCVYCQNHSISTLRNGREITPGRLREIYFELIAQGAHNINLVTPAHFTESILQSLDGALLPVPVVYNTNGYDSVETLRRFEGKVQIFLPDFKYADDTLAEKYSSAPDYAATAAAAVKEMFRQTGPYRIDENGIMQSGVIIRHLILPGNTANSLAVIKFVAENFRPGEVMFSLMRQYIPCGIVSETNFPELNRSVTDAEYAEVQEALFDSGIEDGFLQDEESADAGFIPEFDGSGV